MNCCITGLQWGDEGKGKIVDILSEKCDIIVRYSGGANAGHTVVIGDKKFALHLMPSGAVRQDKLCVIANGVVLNPETFLEEIDQLNKEDITLDNRLFISDSAHVVLDYHITEDQLREEALGSNKIGTTARGIGPCYADKIGRSYALRMGDFKDVVTLKEKLSKIVAYKNRLFKALYNAEPSDETKLFYKCQLFAQKLGPFIIDTTEYLHAAMASHQSVLFEGAQGALLDLDHGTFPFVTSSNASSLGVSAGSGVPAKMIDTYFGVIKAYTTRVGAGPFPSEQDNEIGQFIREKGHEYGTTTGRPRRCGWFDAVAAAYSATIGGIDEIALLHLDTLAGLEEIKICKAYEIDGKRTTFFPSDVDQLAKVKCIYDTVAGWNENLRDITKFDDLPENACKYLSAIEALVKKPITMIGVGPKRSQTIFR